MSVFSDDVLLIHAPKTGGSSARDYLLKYLPGAHDSLKTGGPLPIDSVPLRHIEEYTDRPLSSWQRIVIPVRNPYAQAVSHWCYHWDRYAVGGRHVHDRTAALHKNLTSWVLDPHSDFRVWYEAAVRGRRFRDAITYVSQFGFFQYYIEVGGVIPDNVVVVPCEKLDKEFPQAVAKFCGAEFLMPHSNTSPHSGDPMQYYTNVSKQVIEDRFRWTFGRYYRKVDE